jgi:hypothetical protein
MLSMYCSYYEKKSHINILLYGIENLEIELSLDTMFLHELMNTRNQERIKLIQ